MTQRTAILVHKIGAGSGDHTRSELEAALREHGFDPHYLQIESSSPVDLTSAKGEVVVVAGGDGTLGSLLPQLLTLDRPVIPVPLGTANNVSRSLGIAERFDALSADAVAARFDVGLCTSAGQQRWFAEGVGVGALAAVLRRESDGASGQEKLDRGRSSLADELRTASPTRLRLQLSDGVLEGQFLAIEILNTGATGPSLTLAPEADPGDGLLDLFCIRAEDRDRILTWLQGNRREAPPGIRRQSAWVRFDWDGQSDLRVDNQLVDPASQPVAVEVRIADRPLQVRRPRLQPPR